MNTYLMNLQKKEGGKWGSVSRSEVVKGEEAQLDRIACDHYKPFRERAANFRVRVRQIQVLQDFTILPGE